MGKPVVRRCRRCGDMKPVANFDKVPKGCGRYCSVECLEGKVPYTGRKSFQRVQWW